MSRSFNTFNYSVNADFEDVLTCLVTYMPSFPNFASNIKQIKAN